MVVAQGVGVKQLHDAKAVQRFESLKLLPLQSAEDYTNVLATADVLVALIEADAGMFAVPSKVPSYMCAGRPILLAAPKENLAARIVARACAGIVVDPSDEVGFVAAARRLRDDPQLRAELGANGRAYAERAFDMGGITDKFEIVLMGGRGDPQRRKPCNTDDTDFIVPAVELGVGTTWGGALSKSMQSNAATAAITRGQHLGDNFIGEAISAGAQWCEIANRAHP